jgi:hypothetical protein
MNEPIWGWSVTLEIEPSGRVACYLLNKNWIEHLPSPNARRQAVIDGMANWRYTPFVVDGHAVAVNVTEAVFEYELPAKHLPLPDVSLSEVAISLERGGELEPNAHYIVQIQGDGRVTYTGFVRGGRGNVDVAGVHTYRVPVSDVSHLVDSLRTKDIWSMRAAYVCPIPKFSTNMLTMRMGGQTHTLRDYLGRWGGMLPVVTDFENEIDKFAQSDDWVHLSTNAIEHLQAEHFDFHSRAAADLLARAIADADGHDDHAILRLIELGTPLDGRAGMPRRGIHIAETPFEHALYNHRELLIDSLIARGALATNGKPDQAKIDSAFEAAIASGQLALVQRMWAVAGDKPHPSLTFVYPSDDTHSRRWPVTLLLTRHKREPWDGMQIAQWLAAKGCDLKAKADDGTDLLHIAEWADDPTFVRYLRDQGVGASTPDAGGVPTADGKKSRN